MREQTAFLNSFIVKKSEQAQGKNQSDPYFFQKIGLPGDLQVNVNQMLNSRQKLIFFMQNLGSLSKTPIPEVIYKEIETIKVQRFQHSPSQILSLVDQRIERIIKNKKYKTNWSSKDVQVMLWIIGKMLQNGMMSFKDLRDENDEWKLISSCIPGTTASSCMFKWISMKKSQIGGSNWTNQQSKALQRIVCKIGIDNWKCAARLLYQEHVTPHRSFRHPKQCREHWKCFLDPNLKKGAWEKDQDRILLRTIVQSRGIKKWCKMGSLFEGRTQNAIKNRYKILIDRIKAKQQYQLMRNFRQYQLVQWYLNYKFQNDQIAQKNRRKFLKRQNKRIEPYSQHQISQQDILSNKTKEQPKKSQDLSNLQQNCDYIEKQNIKIQKNNKVKFQYNEQANEQKQQKVDFYKLIKQKFKSVDKKSLQQKNQMLISPKKATVINQQSKIGVKCENNGAISQLIIEKIDDKSNKSDKIQQKAIIRSQEALRKEVLNTQFQPQRNIVLQKRHNNMIKENRQLINADRLNIKNNKQSDPILGSLSNQNQLNKQNKIEAVKCTCSCYHHLPQTVNYMPQPYFQPNLYRYEFDPSNSHLHQNARVIPNKLDKQSFEGNKPFSVQNSSRIDNQHQLISSSFFTEQAPVKIEKDQNLQNTKKDNKTIINQKSQEHSLIGHAIIKCQQPSSQVNDRLKNNSQQCQQLQDQCCINPIRNNLYQMPYHYNYSVPINYYPSNYPYNPHQQNLHYHMPNPYNQLYMYPYIDHFRIKSQQLTNQNKIPQQNHFTTPFNIQMPSCEYQTQNPILNNNFYLNKSSNHKINGQRQEQKN